MTRYLAIIASLALASAAGSGCTNSCKKGTALVSFTLSGNAATADSLQVEVAVGGQSRPSSLALRSGTSSGTFEIDFASGYPIGQMMTVSITALHGTDIVGDGMATATLATGCSSLAVRVDGTGGEVMDLSDQTEMSTSTDMAGGDLAVVACSPATGNQSSQCPAAQPICGTDGSCHACAAHSECTLAICKSDGTCAASSEIAFVDNTSASCSDTAHTSSPASPYCQVQAAIDAFGGFTFIRVAGSATAYKPLNLGSEASPINVTVVGPGRDLPTASMAVLYDSAKAGITIFTVAQPVSLTVDGLFIGGGNFTTSDAVDCTEGSGTAATISIRNSLVKGSPLKGILNNACTLLVDRSIIYGNQGGAIKTGSASFTITNSFMSNNGQLGAAAIGGVEIDSYPGSPAPAPIFAFNTLRNNAAGSTYLGGISCPSPSSQKVNIQNSIVVDNTQDTGSQFSGQCVLQNVVTGTDSFAGATQLTPTFVAAGDPHLTANDAANTACCVDKVTAPTTPNAAHDIDLNHRPKGAAWDIGAHEVQ
jgi:hypothetical protein